MKTQIDVYPQPFEVPQALIVSVNGKALEPPMLVNLPLNTFSPVALDQLCQDFRDGVFKRAGKAPPPEKAISGMDYPEIFFSILG